MQPSAGRQVVSTVAGSRREGAVGSGEGPGPSCAKWAFEQRQEGPAGVSLGTIWGRGFRAEAPSAAGHVVTKSRTHLSGWTTTSSTCAECACVAGGESAKGDSRVLHYLLEEWKNELLPSISTNFLKRKPSSYFNTVTANQ